MMSRRRNQKGFTLVEIMMAVAIIAILAGVSFIGVAGYLRSMAQLERDGIAKEIFVAAQNHLSMAQGQNYLGRNADATKGVKDTASESESDSESESKSDVRYYIVNSGSVTAGGKNDFENGMLGLMLPFASVDETVRMGGNYVIRYQASPARVLDVFYCPTRGHRYLYSLESSNYNTVIAARGEGNKSVRKWFGDSNAVIGWYGGGADLKTGDTLKTPKIKVINKDTLTVEVTDTNDKGTPPLQLIITGVTSKAQKAIDIRAGGSRVSGGVSGLPYQIILDDITQKGLHFRELGADSGTFLPGEDITIQAVAYRNDVLTNVAYSSTKTTNSLFAGLDMESKTTVSGDEVTTTISSTASVTYIRHLENLDQNVSSVSVEALKMQKAEQNSDLSWPDFLTNVGDSSAKIDYGSAFPETAGCYHPVNVAYSLAYDGRGHQISDVLINHTGEKGVFGTYGVQTGSGCSIQNLAILDLKMISTVLEGVKDTNVGHAGALAGSVENTAVTNVIAYNSSDFESRNTGNILTSGVSSASGLTSSAGGLIGLMKGGSVTASAAAVYVESKDGNAGGLIGTIEANTLSGETSVGTISACYAGGHTEDGQYYTVESAGGTTTKTGLYNVKGGAVAGGLIGSASTATITSSYSTCSVSGKTAGGLVGTAGGSASNCYATGLVSGTSVEGAFAGTFAGSARSCKYFEIINERIDDETGVTYLPAVGVDSKAGVEPFDKDAASYEAFTAGPWSEKVSPYDDTLTTYYQGKYNLKTVSQLDGSVTVPAAMTDYIDEYFVEIHHGDWPAPEVFVINTAGGGAAGG